MTRKHRVASALRYRPVTLATLLWWWCQSTPLALAGELVTLSVSHAKGVFSIELEMIVRAPAALVRRVLTDFRHIYRLNPAIVESELLPSPQTGVARVRTLINDCVGIFCVEIERVEDVRTLRSGDLQALTVAELSDVESGVAVWRILPAADHCRIIFRGSIEPRFVFPIIGSYILKKKLHEQMLVNLENLERISRINAGMDVEPDSSAPLKAVTR